MYRLFVLGSSWVQRWVHGADGASLAAGGGWGMCRVAERPPCHGRSAHFAIESRALGLCHPGRSTFGGPCPGQASPKGRVQTPLCPIRKRRKRDRALRGARSVPRSSSVRAIAPNNSLRSESIGDCDRDRVRDVTTESATVFAKVRRDGIANASSPKSWFYFANNLFDLILSR